ncbi:MAG: hypothetical protein ACHP79_00935 [Terriglobales bacterium]
MADNANNTKIWQEAVSATKDCPPIEMLENVELGSADPKAQHVAACAHCQTELAMLRSFEEATPSADEGAAVAWITAQLQRNQNPAVQPKGRVLAWRSLFKVPYMAAAAALIIAITLGVSLYDRSGPGPINGQVGTGNMRSGSIHLVSPIGNQGQVPQQLQWEAVAGAASYTVEVMEVDGHVDWTGKTSQTALAAAPEVKTLAAIPHKPLEWKVTAYDAAGKEIASSGAQRFEVIAK